MLQKYVLPLLAVAALLWAIVHVGGSQKEEPASPPPVRPAYAPFEHTLAGAGITEAQTENIAVGAPLAGIVAEVFVEVGQRVEAGERLFRLDDRHLQADLKVRQANLAAAKAKLARLEQMPRPEELPVAEARVREAQEYLTQQEDSYRRAVPLEQQGTIPAGELIRWRQSVAVAREQLARAKAEYELLKAGAWEADKAAARAEMAQAAAQVEQVETDLDRLLVRAPLAGEVLQRSVQPGAYVGAMPGQALIVLGNVQRLHVRVDIDEHDIPRFTSGARAVAMVRGHADQQYELTFVRVEPYVIPKRSLTGDNTERVDTRVLQVLYALDVGERRLYVGQQLDVYIEALATGQSPARGGRLAGGKEEERVVDGSGT